MEKRGKYNICTALSIAANVLPYFGYAHECWFTMNLLCHDSKDLINKYVGTFAKILTGIENQIVFEEMDMIGSTTLQQLAMHANVFILKENDFDVFIKMMKEYSVKLQQILLITQSFRFYEKLNNLISDLTKLEMLRECQINDLLKFSYTSNLNPSKLELFLTQPDDSIAFLPLFNSSYYISDASVLFTEDDACKIKSIGNATVSEHAIEILCTMNVPVAQLTAEYSMVKDLAKKNLQENESATFRSAVRNIMFKNLDKMDEFDSVPLSDAIEHLGKFFPNLNSLSLEKYYDSQFDFALLPDILKIAPNITMTCKGDSRSKIEFTNHYCSEFYIFGGNPKLYSCSSFHFVVSKDAWSLQGDYVVFDAKSTSLCLNHSMLEIKNAKEKPVISEEIYCSGHGEKAVLVIHKQFIQELKADNKDCSFLSFYPKSKLSLNYPTFDENLKVYCQNIPKGLLIDLNIWERKSQRGESLELLGLIPSNQISSLTYHLGCNDVYQNLMIALSNLVPQAQNLQNVFLSDFDGNYYGSLIDIIKNNTKRIKWSIYIKENNDFDYMAGSSQISGHQLKIRVGY